MVCHITLVTLPGNVEAISRSPTNDPDAVAVRVSSQMRFTVLSPPGPLVMSARTTSPVCAGIVLRVTAIVTALQPYSYTAVRPYSPTAVQPYAIGNEMSRSPAGILIFSPSASVTAVVSKCEPTKTPPVSAVQSPTYVIALVAPVAAGDVIDAAFVRSALSVSLLDVSVPLATRVMPTAVYSFAPVAPGSAVCHDANRPNAEAANAASFHALSPTAVKAPIVLHCLLLMSARAARLTAGANGLTPTSDAAG